MDLETQGKELEATLRAVLDLRRTARAEERARIKAVLERRRNEWLGQLTGPALLSRDEAAREFTSWLDCLEFGI